MSDDDETARQIAELASDSRPLLVVDVDEVVLDFVTPFGRYLNSQGLELLTDSFRIHGNVVALETREVVDNARVSAEMTAFFEVQAAWQSPVPGAVATLALLSAEAEIVLLSAMPHRHRSIRRQLLDSFSLPYPLVSTEGAKGPAVRQIRGASPRPAAFVDDIPRNLQSVADSVPDAALFHMMSHQGLRALVPSLPEGAVALQDWNEAAITISAALGIDYKT